MVSKGEAGFVLWPHYFDAALTRRQGRRVSEAVAVKGPDAAWIETAAKRLKLDPRIEDKAAHPSVPYERSGRVVVSKQGSKEAVIRLVAAKLHEMQAANESR
ncbi:MAG: signal recognition particle subunit SRP19/SEC65 family protein [bacterium]